MSDEPATRTQDAAISAFMGLLAAFQHAVVYAAFSERLDVNGDATRIDALSEKLICVAEGGSLARVHRVDDATGTGLATSAIRQIITDIRHGVECKAPG